MKEIIATLLIAAAVGNVQAEGFYDKVINQTNRAALAAQEVAGPNDSVTAEQLEQVINARRDYVRGLGETGISNDFVDSWTPLYEKVKGIV